MIVLNELKIFEILWIALVSFTSAFAKELNEYAMLKPNKKNYLLFVSKVLLSGVCGILIGVLAIYFYDNIYIETVAAGLGGLLGLSAIRSLIKIFLALKKIDMSVLDDDILEKDLKRKKK